MTTTSPQTTDAQLKAKHRAMWASGDYPAVAAEAIPATGPRLVDFTGVQAGDRVLDIAAGSGNASIPAARRGAAVVASDLTPELFDAGRRRAEEAGVRITWQQADAEALPYRDGEFDVALSCVGIMFAPHHELAAAELLRVTSPEGRIGLLSWTPDGFIGRLFTALKPFVPPPPPGAQPPPLWGSEDHVRALLGNGVTDVRATKEKLRVDRFAAPEDMRDFFRDKYGPTITAYKVNAGDPARLAELDRAIVDLATKHHHDGVMEWEYLLLTATRAG
jgi:SAM-dependent methyltransferase